MYKLMQKIQPREDMLDLIQNLLISGLCKRSLFPSQDQASIEQM